MKFIKYLSFYFYASLLIFAATSCEKDSNTPDGNLPVADFTFSPPNGYKPLTVFFGDKSTNATRYEWDFGNGQSSNSQNPTTTYINDGVYTITLKVSNDDGTDKITKTISVKNPPNSVLITKIEIIEFPETTDDGDNWDSSFSGSYPDVYFQLTDESGNTLYSHSVTDRRENLRNIDLPVSWTKSDGFYEVQDLNQGIGVRLMDFESIVSDQTMGVVLTTTTFLERIVIEDGNLPNEIFLSDGYYTFRLGLSWVL